MVSENENDMISVILPVYNSEKFLAAAIESILNQSYKSFELLIFNDGSTDGSAAIIEQYSDSRIVFVNSPENKGYLHWLNVGISASKGKYIARMDSDDIALPDRFELQIQFLELHPEIAIAGTGILVFDEINPEKKVITVSSEREIRWGLIFKNMLVHPSVMMRREAITNAGLLYKQAFYGSEDYRFWTDAIKAGLRVTNLQDVLLRYREHGNNFTKKNRERQVENSKKIAKDYLRFLMPDVPETKAELMVQRLYTDESTSVTDVYHDFKLNAKKEDLETIIPFLRTRLMELFFQNPVCSLSDVFRFRKALRTISSPAYSDGKNRILFKHYLKVKLRWIK